MQKPGCLFPIYSFFLSCSQLVNTVVSVCLKTMAYICLNFCNSLEMKFSPLMMIMAMMVMMMIGTK